MDAKLTQYAGWSAFASAFFTILGLATLIMFFSRGNPWGTLNDISSVALALSVLPILLMLYHLLHPVARTAGLAALVIGVLAMLIAAVFQTLLIFKVIAFVQTAVIVPVAFGLFGASLMVYGYLALAYGMLPHRLAVLGIIAGVGYIVVIAGFILGGQEHPLVAIGGLTAVIFYPIWAIWFGQMLLAGRLAT